jgi:flagellar biosynthesis/type III secretory pathway protein FliH
MKDVSILPPDNYHHSPFLSTQIARKARKDAYALLKKTRAKAAKYLLSTRNRGRKEGLQEGLELARSELQLTLQLWSQQLNECLAQLSTQVEEGALALAAQIVGKELRERATAYRPWLEEAMTALRKENSLTLYCSPEQFEMIGKLTKHSNPSITVYADQSLSVPEIYIQSKLGRIGFGWKEALECAATGTKSK